MAHPTFTAGRCGDFAVGSNRAVAAWPNASHDIGYLTETIVPSVPASNVTSAHPFAFNSTTWQRL